MAANLGSCDPTSSQDLSMCVAYAEALLDYACE